MSGTSLAPHLRPARAGTLSSRVPPDLEDAVRQAAREHGVKPADIVRQACRTYVDDLALRPAPSAQGVLSLPTAYRRDDPATSKRAASDTAPRAATGRARALVVIAAADGRGATADEVHRALQAKMGATAPPQNSTARRVADLLEVHAIRADTTDEGYVRLRDTSSGSVATVYVLTPKGRSWLAQLGLPPST